MKKLFTIIALSLLLSCSNDDGPSGGCYMKVQVLGIMPGGYYIEYGPNQNERVRTEVPADVYNYYMNLFVSNAEAGKPRPCWRGLVTSDDE